MCRVVAEAGVAVERTAEVVAAEVVAEATTKRIQSPLVLFAECEIAGS
jgi:hypothetical protein